MKGLILIGAFVLATIVVFVTNWLALIPWRKNKDKHWSEQARLLHPVFASASSNLLMVPATVTLLVLLFWPGASLLWFFAGILSLIGATVANFFLTHEVFSRIPISELFRQTAIGLFMKFLIWPIFIGAAVLMPDEFNSLAWSIGGAVFLFWMIWAKGGSIWLLRKLGLLQPAPDRLRNIVEATSARMNVPYGEALLMRSYRSQAFAVFNGRKVIFTERLLEILSDEEIAAICAHELAHLTESKTTRYTRTIRMLALMPWIFLSPLLAQFGIVTFFGLLAITAIVPRIYGQISRKLESRADSMAKANQENEGVYARALAKLYEDNLVPAVISNKRATHPNLYDRLLAAGVTPDFPRPAPASSIAWHGRIFSWSAGILFGIFVARFAQSFYGTH